MHNFLSWAQLQPDKMVLVQAETGESFTAGRIAGRALQIARLRALAVDADLDPELAEKFLTFIVAEVVRHHEKIARGEG